MKIVIYGINFSPEMIGVGKYTGELAEWLASRGHAVKVITAPPYYPGWKVNPPYSAAKYHRDGDRLIRCPIWVPSKPSGLKRIIHLASFAISSFPPLIYQVFWRPDLVWVVEPTLLCAPGAILVSRMSGSSAWLHVQDFEVDAAFKLGFLSSIFFRNLIMSGERWLMRQFDCVSTISGNMADGLHKKGVPAASVRLFPNWVDTDLIRPLNSPSPYRSELGLPDNAIVVMYSGNMGSKQGLEILVAAARLLRLRSNLRFVFCGDGADRDNLVAHAAGLGNVTFLPLQPTEKLNDLLNLADMHLLPQKGDAADLVMPSKLTGMLASGRPVVATAKQGTQLAATVAGNGIVVEPDNARAFADAISLLADDARLRGQLGTAARQYAVTHLGKQAILNEFEKAFSEIANVRRRAKGQP